MAIKISGNTVIDDNQVLFPINTVDKSVNVSISTNTLTIDLNTGTIFNANLTSNITTLTINNVQAAGQASSFLLNLTADGTARTVTWPASFKWPGGVAPTISTTSGKIDTFAFVSVDGNTSWQAFIAGQSF